MTRLSVTSPRTWQNSNKITSQARGRNEVALGSDTNFSRSPVILRTTTNRQLYIIAKPLQQAEMMINGRHNKARIWFFFKNSAAKEISKSHFIYNTHTADRAHGPVNGAIKALQYEHNALGPRKKIIKLTPLKHYWFFNCFRWDRGKR